MLHAEPLSETPFEPAVQPPAGTDNAYAIVFRGQEILAGTDPAWPVHELMAMEGRCLLEQGRHFIGYWQRRPCFVLDVEPAMTAPGDTDWMPLRSLLINTDRTVFSLLATARQVVEWGRNQRFCGRCGTPTEHHVRDRAMCCPNCGLTQYPRLSPCIIVLVSRGDEVLLARSPRFKPGVYSTLAGFIEPGESAEQALHREVMEEVGVRVKNLRYLASQSWPFPHSLMLGFHAEHAGGEIQVDGVEIEDARWWPLDALPKPPTPYAISYYLLDQYLRMRGAI